MVSTEDWANADVEDNLRFSNVNKQTGEVTLKPGVKAMRGSGTDLVGGMTYNCSVGNYLDRPVFMRGYIIVVHNNTGDGNNPGEAYIIYTDAVKATWNTAHNGTYEVFTTPDISGNH